MGMVRSIGVVLFCGIALTMTAQRPELMNDRDTFPIDVRKVVKVVYDRMPPKFAMRDSMVHVMSFDKKHRLETRIATGSGVANSDSIFYLDKHGSRLIKHHTDGYVNSWVTEHRNRSGKLIQLVRESTSGDSIVEDYYYDGDGKLMRWTQNEWLRNRVSKDSTGRIRVDVTPPFILEATSKEKVYSYNEKNQLILVRSRGELRKKWSLLDSVLYGYYEDGKLKSQVHFDYIDRDTISFEFRYNDLGKIDSVLWVSQGYGQSEKQAICSYTYDAYGYVSSIKLSHSPARTEIWTSTYDKHGFPLERIHETNDGEGHESISVTRWRYY